MGELTTMLSKFENITNQILECGNDIIFAVIDLPSKAICNSACLIDDAFRKMMETNNFLCGGALIRMQIDNAINAWIGLICNDLNRYYANFATDTICDGLLVSWENLKAFGINKEMFCEDDLPAKNKLYSKFARKALTLLHPRTLELYERSSDFIHPSAVLFKACWFAEETNTIEIKSWREVKPVKYTEDKMVKDYLDSCYILLWVMQQWLKLKQHYVNLVMHATIDSHAAVSAKEKKKVDDALNLLRHD